MEIADAFKFCPLCGKSFVRVTENYLMCSQCGHKHFINPAPCASAILWSEFGILIVKRKDEPYKGTWQTPGGFIQPNENVYEALKRELKEEVSETAMVDDMIASLKGVYPFNDLDIPFIAIYYRGIIDPEGIIASDDAEEYAWINSENFNQFIITYKNLEQLIEEELKRGNI